jgi:hypothetical protein
MTPSTLPPTDLARQVDALAAVVGLPLRPEHHAGVSNYFALAAGFAALVMSFELGPHDEPAESFVPVEPPQRPRT